MKVILPRIAAALSLGLAAPLLAHGAITDAPAQEANAPAADTIEEQTEASPFAAPVATEVPATTEPAQQAPVAAEEAKEEELICRSIRLDMSSRRKTRVCRTEEGWRLLNQQR